MENKKQGKQANSSVLVMDGEYDFQKILKSNSIIFGRTTKDSPKTLYAKDLKILNFLFRLLQEGIRQDREVPNNEVTIEFPLEIYRLTMDSGISWKRDLINSVKRISAVSYELENFFNNETKEKVDYQRTMLLGFPKFYSSQQKKISDTLRVTFSREIAMACWQKVNYTHLSFGIIKKLKRKYSIQFYENLTAKLQRKANEDDLEPYIELNKEDLIKIFDNAYRPELSIGKMLGNIIKFKDIIFPELQESLPVILDYETFSDDYILRFKLDKNKIKDYKTQKMNPFKFELKKFENLISVKHQHRKRKEGVIDTSSILYTFDPEKINEALENFLQVLYKYFVGRELLKTKEEKEKFGNVILNADGDFYDKDKGYLKLSIARKESLLKHLYTNSYTDIMSSIETDLLSDMKKENKEEIRKILGNYKNRWIRVDNENYGLIYDIKFKDYEKVQVSYKLYILPSEDGLSTGTHIAEFDDFLTFSDYFIKNKV